MTPEPVPCPLPHSWGWEGSGAGRGSTLCVLKTWCLKIPLPSTAQAEGEESIPAGQGNTGVAYLPVIFQSMKQSP